MTERSAQQREPLDLDGLVASLREWAAIGPTLHPRIRPNGRGRGSLQPLTAWIADPARSSVKTVPKRSISRSAVAREAA